MGGHSGGGGRSGRGGGGGGGGIGETPSPITVTEAKQLAEEIPAKPISPGFTPAPTTAVAINRANRMGVKMDIKGNSAKDLTAANDVNKWLYDRKQNGYPLPKSIVIDKTIGRDTVAVSNNKFSRIAINPNNWEAGKKQSKRFETTSTLDHEMGHILHYQNSPTTFNAMLKTYKTPANTVSPTVKKHVSTYAGSDKLEFVAEVYSGKVAGKTYPAAVNKLYADLKGPKV